MTRDYTAEEHAAFAMYLRRSEFVRAPWDGDERIGFIAALLGDGRWFGRLEWRGHVAEGTMRDRWQARNGVRAAALALRRADNVGPPLAEAYDLTDQGLQIVERGVPPFRLADRYRAFVASPAVKHATPTGGLFDFDNRQSTML